MELKDYMLILGRRKWVILACLLAALITVFIGTRLQTPIYESSVTLRVAASATGQLSYSSTTYATQLLNTTAQIATSGPVLNELVQRMNLPEVPKVVSEVIPNTELIKLTVENPDPKLAAEEASVLAQIIMSQSNSVYTGGEASSVNILGTQVAQAEQSILQTRKQYTASLLVTPAVPANTDLLYQELLLQQRNYDSLLSQYQSAQIQNEMRSHMITVVDAPIVADKPSKPNLYLDLLIGLAAGLVVGVILAFIVDNMDDTLYSAHDIEHYSGFPTFSRIPKVKKSLTSLSVLKNSAFTDSFRELALKIQQVARKRGVKVILVFSAEPNQGKSMIVSHLAVSLSEFGKKVIAVDCDLRMPKLHKWFNLQNSVGLKEVIEGNFDLASAIQPTGFENLWVLTSGDGATKPALLLGSNVMKTVIGTLERDYDYVLLDTPALLAVGDAEVISEYADALILVARRKETTRSAAVAAGRFLHDFPDKFTALVVNQDSTSDGYYYHRSEPKYEKLSSDFLIKRLQSQQSEQESGKNNPGNESSVREVDPDIEKAVIEMAMEQPLFGQIRVTNELQKRNIKVTPALVRTIWLKHGLETFEKRSQVLKEQLKNSEKDFSEAQMLAIRKLVADEAAEAEIDSSAPGELGVQDETCIGRVDGVGRVYQQVFIDTHTGFTFARVYRRKEIQSAIDLLEKDVIPFYKKENIPLQRILTNREVLYCGKDQENDYERFLSANHIQHDFTDEWHIKTNGISLRFEKTIRDEFYQVVSRTRTYTSLEELQQDLDAWLYEYNHKRSYPEKYCYGRTPYETMKMVKQFEKMEVA